MTRVCPDLRTGSHLTKDRTEVHNTGPDQESEFAQKAYRPTSIEGIKELYKEWASTYNREVGDVGYAEPQLSGQCLSD